jgi:DNA-binding NarL/FixJ family response regulator
MSMDFLVKMFEDQPPAPFNPTVRQVSVLLVDDNPQVLHDLRQLLELTGLFKVLGEARDGAVAVQLAANLAPDAIVMDLEMPGMDGYEATRRIKACQGAPRVIILSVHNGPIERERARAAGVDSFVTKGADYEVLVQALLGELASPDSSGNLKRGS